jgi:hypothetical protein
MDNALLKGLWKYMVPVPPFMWQKTVRARAGKARAKLKFMTSDHHLVRNFVVGELPRAGVPLGPQTIARALNLTAQRIVEILNDLEKHKVFLFRNTLGQVTWAYPVTVDKTPHKVVFPSGEQIYAA